MNARFEGGASTALLIVDSLTIRVGEMKLSCTTPFPLHFEVEYWPAIRGSEDEPSSEQYLALMDARLLSPIFMSTFAGLTLSIDARLNVLELLSNEQHEILVKALLQPSEGAVNTCKVNL